MAIRLNSPAQLRAPRSLGTEVRRDLEVGRFDHVPTGAPWLRSVAHEAARIAGVPAAAVNLMRATTQRTVAAIGIDVTLLDRKDAMCGPVVDSGRRVHVPDASQDARWADNPLVDGRWNNIRLYAAHPLVAWSGFTVGTLCVFDTTPRELDEQQIEALDALADDVVDKLETSRLEFLRGNIRTFVRTALPGWS